MTTPLAPAASASTSDPLLERLRLSTAGTYDIAGELGRGGMAVVYLAHDLKLDRRVAIKVMDPRLSLTPGMSARFLLEARIAARLQHPNIIVVHDIRQDQELSYFVMSFVEGMAADHLCQPGTSVAIDDVRWIIAGAARALAHAHAEAIVHRDIKPANILVNVKGDVILTDFGIAKALGGTSLTQSGTQVGTPSYMSPEQFTNRPVGPASDQYSLGVTAYTLLTGRLPFTGELYELIVAHSNAVPVPVQQLRPDCPAFLSDAVMRMLAKDPDQRWPSMHDVAEVVSETLPANGGRALAAVAHLAQQARVQQIPALQALTPVSPVPAGRTPAPVAEPVIAELRLGTTTFELEVGAHVILPLRAFDAAGAPLPTSGLDFLFDRPDAVTLTPESLRIDAQLAGDTRLIIAPRHAFASGTTPTVRASCVFRVRAPQVASVIAEVREETERVTAGKVAAVAEAAEAPAVSLASSVVPKTPASGGRRFVVPAALAAMVLAYVVFRQVSGATGVPSGSNADSVQVASLPPTPVAQTPSGSVGAAAATPDTVNTGNAPTDAGTVPSANTSRVASASGPTTGAAAAGATNKSATAKTAIQEPVTLAPAPRASTTLPSSAAAVPSPSRDAAPQTTPKTETGAEPARSTYGEPVDTRTAAATTAPVSAPPSPAPTAETSARLPSMAEMRQAATDLFNALRATKGASVREIANFFRDGSDHRLAMIGSVKVLEGRTSSRGQFELQVSKKDFSGRQAVGVALVTFLGEQRDGQVVPALESVGPISRVR